MLVHPPFDFRASPLSVAGEELLPLPVRLSRTVPCGLIILFFPRLPYEEGVVTLLVDPHFDGRRETAYRVRLKYPLKDHILREMLPRNSKHLLCHAVPVITLQLPHRDNSLRHCDRAARGLAGGVNVPVEFGGEGVRVGHSSYSLLVVWFRHSSPRLSACPPHTAWRWWLSWGTRPRCQTVAPCARRASAQSGTTST